VPRQKPKKPTAADLVAQVARKKQRRGRTWTEEQRAEQSRKMREYYAANPSPRKGVPTPEDVKEKQRLSALARVPLGSCMMCDGDLFDEEAVALGVGPECLERGLRDGYMQVVDGQVVLDESKVTR
jgi:hypothetical protein